MDLEKNRFGVAEDGVADRTEWVKKYIVPNIKTIKADSTEFMNDPVIYFAYGSALPAHQTAGLFFLFGTG